MDKKIRLLKRTFLLLNLIEIPKSIVSRRLTIFNNFEKNKSAFEDEELVNWYGEVLGKGKNFTKDNLTAQIVFNFINEHEELWEETFKLEDISAVTKIEIPQDIPKRFQLVLERNKYTPQPLSETNSMVKNVFTALTRNSKFEYSIIDFEKEILYKLEGCEQLSHPELIEEAVKAYETTVYKEDGMNSYRFLFEEFKVKQKEFELLGINFIYPQMKMDHASKDKVSVLMGASLLAFKTFGGIFELKRVIRTANRVANVAFTEEEVHEFFKAYLEGLLDLILLKGPENKGSYLLTIERTIDYNFQLDNFAIYPNIEFFPSELTSISQRLLGILVRAKILEWTKNVQIGEERTLLDLLKDFQNHLGLILPSSKQLLSFQEMFENTDLNLIESAIKFFSKELTYSFLLAVNKGGIENSLLEAIKNLSGAPRGLGNQILSIKKYYQSVFPDSWPKQFFYGYIIKTASKGLSTSTKRTVTERLNLMVAEDPRPIKGAMSFGPRKTGDKIKSDVIYERLRKIPFINPLFTTADEAQNYLKLSFLAIRLEISKAWIKDILRKGFELYIEQPVKQAWLNEMEDLSREIIRYYQDLVALDRSTLEINELVVESLRESFNIPSLDSIPRGKKDSEVLSMFIKLPENHELSDREGVEHYLNSAFNFSKKIINSLINREVEEEVDRKTFDEEIEERTKLDKIVIDWYIRASHVYSEIIDISLGLERTSDPDDLLLKTLYGGVIFLVEEGMKGLVLKKEEKIQKGLFLRDLLSKQLHSIKECIEILQVPYTVEMILNFLIDQIELFNQSYNIRGIISKLESDNRLQKALPRSNRSSVLNEPSILSLIAREFITSLIKKWANSTINIVEIIVKILELKEEVDEEREQKILQMFFYGTGRNDIRNFIYPFIVGNVRHISRFETASMIDELHEYTLEVFPEAVQCDAQIAMNILSKALSEEGELSQTSTKRQGNLDLIYYLGSSIQSCNNILNLYPFSEGLNFSLSDVVKKATGLSLLGLNLETIVFQLDDSNLSSIASYVENPYEGSQITGLTLELITKENIPLGTLNPLSKNASQVLSGLIDRNQKNLDSPDKLYKEILIQLLNEAELLLMSGIATEEDLFSSIQSSKSELRLMHNVSQSTLRVTTAYRMKLQQIIHEQMTCIIPEIIEFWGENIKSFSAFAQLVVPFLDPAQEIKEKLQKNSKQFTFLNNMDIQFINNKFMYPSLLIFDDNGRYKVIFIHYVAPDYILILIAQEEMKSKMGLRTIQYLLKTRYNFFEELVADFNLLPLNELNQCFPLNKIRVMKGNKLDSQLIQNISFGAI
ncbi:hypothetical protein [Candidatus Hodarchaeum mangrovi]